VNTNVLTAAEGFVRRASAKGRAGSLADASELAALNREMGGRMPDWLVELLTSVPLCGLSIGLETAEDEYSLLWNGVRGMRSESLESYPGIAVLTRGYVSVASDGTGGGDPFFIAADDGNDPPLYQVYHDVGEQVYHDVGEAAGEILAAGRVTVAASLSSLFLVAQPY
jgi:hypothetical protein